MDAPALPSQRHGAGNMIQQAGGAPRVALIVLARDLARKADGAIAQLAQTVAPGLRHIGAVVEAGVQVSGECRFRTVAADRALQRVDSDDVAGAFPDRTEM